MASEHDFQGPGVVKPHPKKNWVNPDAHPVYGPDAGRARGGSSRRPAAPSGPTPDGPGPDGPGPDGPRPDRTGRSPLRLIAGLVGLILLLVVAYLVWVFLID